MHKAVHADANAVHFAHGHLEHHWETSWAPAAISFGVLLLVPVAFALKFVYQYDLGAVIAAGAGTPLVLAGIAKWIQEGATQHAAITNVSPVGIGVFIIGEILIFLGLFASYWTLRLSTGTAWPPAGTPHINTVLPLIMTAILVASSITYHYAEDKLGEGHKGSFLVWLLVSVALGASFLGCTIYEYSHLIEEGFLPGTNQYSAAFYSLTGFHGSHVFVGLVSFLAIFIGTAIGRVNTNLVKVAGIYWHFVDVIWFFVASQVYFW
jgi:cytochrome c oxidase subunit 3